MIQPSILYGFFLACVLFLFWVVPRKRARLWVLVISSLIFYATLQAQYVPLMLVLVGLNFALGKALGAPLDWRIPNEAWEYAQADWQRRRTRLLVLGIALNGLLLLGFKYLLPLLTLLGLEKLDLGRLGLSGLGLKIWQLNPQRPG